MEWFTDKERMLINSLYQLDLNNGSNTVLDAYMRSKRIHRPILPSSKRYELYESIGLTQLWFQTPPCRFSVSGKCTMCNYWNGKHIPGLVKQIVTEVKLQDSCHTLLINTCGSCLDTREIPRDELICLLGWIANAHVESVIFESHWTTLTNDTLSLIHEILSHKKVFYEIGIESTNPDSLFYLLNKPSSLTDFRKIIERVHSYNAQCIMNIIFGTPFLNSEEQILDAVSSIHELFEKQADYVVLFPINIKPCTLVMDLYKHQQYARVPIKMIAELLLDHFADVLDKINVAWFGDRFEEGVIPPASCDTCGASTVELLKRYNDENENDARQKILEQITAIHCGCKEKYISFRTFGTLHERLNKYYSELNMGRW